MSRNLTILVGITLAGFALVGCSKNITGPQVGNDHQVGTLNAVAPVKEVKEFEVQVSKNLYPETNTQNQMQAAAVEEIKKEDLGSNDTDEIAPKLRKQLESGSVAQKMEAAAAVPVTEKQKEDGSDNDTDELAPKLRKQLESGNVAQKMEAAAAVPVTEKQKEDGSDNDTDELAPKLRKQLESGSAAGCGDNERSAADAEVGE